MQDDALMEPLEDGGVEVQITKAVSTEINQEMIDALTQAGDLADKFWTALRRVLVKCTYPADWTIQGSGEKAKACLSSHGAERVAVGIGGFVIEESQPATRTPFKDKHGEGYIWRFFYKVTWRGRSCDAMGLQSTRDLFVGKAHGEFKDIGDINEANVMRGARHVAIGEGIKQLLGLRNLPASEMPKFGMGTPDAPIPKVDRDSQDAEERTKRKSITDMLLALNDGDQDAAKAHLTEITTFMGRDKKEVRGVTSTKYLKDKRLNFVLAKVTELHTTRFGGDENPDQTQKGGGA